MTKKAQLALLALVVVLGLAFSSRHIVVLTVPPYQVCVGSGVEWHCLLDTNARYRPAL